MPHLLLLVFPSALKSLHALFVCVCARACVQIAVMLQGKCHYLPFTEETEIQRSQKHLQGHTVGE